MVGNVAGACYTNIKKIYFLILKTEAVRVVFYPMYPDYQKTIVCEGSQALPSCPGKCNMETEMRAEFWWRDTYRGKLLVLLENPAHLPLFPP